MLNISKTSIDNLIDQSQYKTFDILRKKNVTRYLYFVIGAIGLILLIWMLLPWTQNIRAKGYVTTLNPFDRPQTIQSLIGGRIEKWYVSEGQLVQVGDTIVVISEVKEDYLDPRLLQNTDIQIVAKEEASKAYTEKVVNLNDQLQALALGKQVKLKQVQFKYRQSQLKIQSDSIDLEANRIKLGIAKAQLIRTENLFDQGIKPLTDLELKRAYFQEAQAKVVEIQNKIDGGYNDLLNLNAELIAIENEYRDKIAKSRSEINSTLSNKFDTDATVGKLKSQYNSYEQRAYNYVIKSPITGYVTKAIQSGIGEIVKNGEDIVSIMPKEYQLAVETYIEPRDLPLINKGQRVMIQFDGWPSIVFSGWPNSSFGTFAGEVYAVDNFISDNGKYRLLISEHSKERKWPREIRVGGGANTISLLKDVKVGYEIWRQLNGFPPNYYKPSELESTKSKAPLRKVK